jgi:hypothetical protein
MVRKQKKKMHYIQLDNGGVHVDHTDDLQTYRHCVRCVDTPVQRRVVAARVVGSKKLFCCCCCCCCCCSLFLENLKIYEIAVRLKSQISAWGSHRHPTGVMVHFTRVQTCTNVYQWIVRTTL